MLEALKKHGADAVSFQALKAGTRVWTDAPPPGGTGARLAYTPSGRSWIAIGTPLVEDARRAEAVRRFIRAARDARRRPVFFGIENTAPFEGCRTLLLGLQPVLRIDRWDETLRARPKLREQLRRARAKGVTVREVDAAELVADTPLRRAVDRLRAEWLASRHMEPMRFLVEVDPLREAREHVYIVAERDGVAVQFLSAVPIYAAGGWLMEDMLRGRDAPNGSTELVIDAVMRRAAPAQWITPGLTPLTGPIPWWMRAARVASVALYDFAGLLRFRARLRPADWRPIWLAWDRGSVAGPLFDVLQAFAGGRIVSFALRSLTLHPNGPPWAVAVPLVAWTALIAALAASGAQDLLGYPRHVLWAWVLFDAVLAWLLFKAARRPRRRALGALAAVAGFDAIVSLRHLAGSGWGETAASAVLRTVASAGPVIGTIALTWAAWRVHDAARRRDARPC